jgi:hypothetical protein
MEDNINFISFYEELSSYSYNNLLNHYGHDICIVKYGTVEENGKEYPLNVSLECEDCNEVIDSYDRGD